MSDPQNEMITNEQAYAAGRVYASLQELPPCSTWLETELGFDACLRQYFLLGFKRTKESWPQATAVDLRIRECRCSKGCGSDWLPFSGFD